MLTYTVKQSGYILFRIPHRI